MVLPTTRAHPNQYHGSTTRAHPNKYDKNDESKKHNFYIHVSCVEVCTWKEIIDVGFNRSITFSCPRAPKEKASQSLEAGQAENDSSEKADDAKVPKRRDLDSSSFKLGCRFKWLSRRDAFWNFWLICWYVDNVTIFGSLWCTWHDMMSEYLCPMIFWKDWVARKTRKSRK